MHEKECAQTRAPEDQCLSIRKGRENQFFCTEERQRNHSSISRQQPRLRARFQEVSVQYDMRNFIIFQHKSDMHNFIVFQQKSDMHNSIIFRRTSESTTSQILNAHVKIMSRGSIVASHLKANSKSSWQAYDSNPRTRHRNDRIPSQGSHRRARITQPRKIQTLDEGIAQHRNDRIPSQESYCITMIA